MGFVLMKKKILISALFGIGFLSVFAAVLLLSGKFVIAGGGLLPAHASRLNLKKRNLSIAQYEEIHQKLPECVVLWSVPFQGGRVPSDAEVVTISSYDEEDAAKLAYFTNLKTVDGTGCEDFQSLYELQCHNPDLSVLYNVIIDGTKYGQDTTVIDVPNLTADQIAALECLPMLNQVNAAGCTNEKLLLQAQKDHPYWNMHFDVRIQGKLFSADTQNAALSGCNAEELNLILSALGQLKSLQLDHPAVTGDVLTAARKAYPNTDIHWTVDIYGQDCSDTLKELEISGVKLSGVDEAKAAAAYFPDLERITLIDTELDDAEIAAYRDEARDRYKVVWKLYIGRKSVAMSDDTWFFPTQQRDYYFQDADSYKLRYLEDCIAVDVGDQPNLKNVEWAVGMPHLQYLILAHTNVTNISALANCKELKFLECDLDNIHIKDLTPLNECTAMEDLNLGYTVGDASQIAGMTWLKHLWWRNASVTDQKLLMESLCGAAYTFDAEGNAVDPEGNILDLTDKTVLRFQMQSAVGAGWRRLPGYYAMRDALHAPYDTTVWV